CLAFLDWRNRCCSGQSSVPAAAIADLSGSAMPRLSDGRAWRAFQQRANRYCAGYFSSRAAAIASVSASAMPR
ncbi:hypothetical protein, partial [Erwinia amylovora]|uniref:hypothetical protein n=1 Tax=Erwinia amylovora TaxID=552 RepID=UPI00196AF03E